MSHKSLGAALRAYKNDPIFVTTRMVGIVQVQMQDEAGKVQTVPMQQPISFRAVSFREIEKDSDVWEFRAVEQNEKGEHFVLICFHGEDIAYVKTMPKVNI